MQIRVFIEQLGRDLPQRIFISHVGKKIFSPSFLVATLYLGDHSVQKIQDKMCSPSYFMNILAWCFIQFMWYIEWLFSYSFFPSLNECTELFKMVGINYNIIREELQYHIYNILYTFLFKKQVFYWNLSQEFFFENESKRCVSFTMYDIHRCSTSLFSA